MKNYEIIPFVPFVQNSDRKWTIYRFSCMFFDITITFEPLFEKIKITNTKHVSSESYPSPQCVTIGSLDGGDVTRMFFLDLPQCGLQVKGHGCVTAERLVL